MSLPPIPNAFENVKAACDQRLAELYPAGIPEEITLRYQQELSFLQNSDKTADFEVFRQLCDERRKCAHFFCTDQVGASSILTYLLERSFINPMPAHYYCPHCGLYEPIALKVVGPDLPPKKCPQCDHSLRADGFNLPATSFWGINSKRGYLDYLISPNFFPFARRRLQSIYPNRSIVPFVTGWNLTEVEHKATFYCDGFAILPDGTTLDDYPELVGYLPSGERCLSYDRQTTTSFASVIMHPHKQIHRLFRLQQETGLYCSDISQNDIRPLSYYDFINTASFNNTTNSFLDSCIPKNYYETILFVAAKQNHYESEENTLRDVAFDLCSPYSHKRQKDACFTREDVQEKLMELGYDHDTAFKYADVIRKGILLNNPPSKKEHQAIKADLKNSLLIPDSLKEYLLDCKYLCSRVYVTTLVIIAAMLAYYQKHDSRIYAKIVFQD